MTQPLVIGPRLIMTQAHIDENRQLWLDARTHGITGTDVAAILNLSSHMSPFGLFHGKLSGVETMDKPVMQRGRHLEPVIDDMLRDQYPGLDPQPAGLFRHPQRDWMMATLDRQILDCEAAPGHVQSEWFGGEPVIGTDHVSVGEYKTWATTDGWGDAPHGKMPTAVRAQGIWNGAVYGADLVRVVVLFMTQWRLAVYEIHMADASVQTDLAFMIAAAERFRTRLTEHDEPPVDDHPATTETLRKLHPGLVDESVAVPMGLGRRYHRARAAKKKAEDRLRGVQNELRHRMGPAARAHVVLPDGTIVKVCSRSIGDTPVKAFTRHDDKLNPGRGEL